MKKLFAACLAASLALAAPASAQHGPPHSPGPPPVHHDFHGDPGHWHGGSWFHGNHGGVYGWWWAVDGAYYAYPAPVYDPNYYDPGYYAYGQDPGYDNSYAPPPYGYAPQQPYAPQPYAPQQSYAQPPYPQQQPNPGGTWYYCANPPGYYPNVGQCSVQWQPVPAQPQR
jgi:hypothetical protein